MFKQLLTWVINILDRPFPIIDSFKTKLIYVLSFGLFISFFIVVFKPFGYNNLGGKLFYNIATAYGISSSVSLAVVSFLFPIIYPSYFDKNRWNIGRQVSFMLAFFIIFTSVNWLVYHYFNIKEITGFSPEFIIGISLSLGITPSLLYILVIERQYLKSFQLNQLDHVYSESIITDTDIKLFSSNNKLEYNYNSSQIRCVKGCGNYYILYFDVDGVIHQQIIRNTLKSVEDKLCGKQFIRCHKSYIVNSNEIDLARGNIKNLKLHITNIDFDIPVSRSISQAEFLFLKERAKLK